VKSGIGIINKPLPQYIRDKNKIIFRYEGLSLTILLRTVFLALATKKYLEETNNNFLQVFISCHDSLFKWVPKSLKPFYFQDLQYKPIGSYEIKTYDYLLTNHREIAQTLGIGFPLDIKNILNTQSIKKEKKVLLCCSGDAYVALPEIIERDLYNHFKSNGYDVKIMAIVNQRYDDKYWAKNILTYKDTLSGIIQEMETSEIIICVDNYYLELANVFLDKKVIGIFGPTIPSSILKHNSMKLIQYQDEDPIDSKTKKSCICKNPKYCHRKYVPGKTPYCLEKITPIKLIEKINDFIN